MRVAALVHFALPWRSAGSETVLHELLKAAAQDGHDATGFITNRDAARNWHGTEPEIEFDGVRLVRVRNAVMGGRLVGQFKPDVLISHHQHVLHSQRVARIIGARSVFLTHNDYDLNKRPLSMKPDLVIHNSEHVRDSLARFGEPKSSMVFHPPLTPDRHTVPETGDAYTLVNLNEDKGVDLFYDLAERMPHSQFIGVVGGHGVQKIRRNLPNVTILEHGADMKRVWSQTRVLLMPSKYESYGLVAVEAAINGIPTIAHPTPGLRENLGDGGLFADRDQPDEWVAHLSSLSDQFAYADASFYARGLAQSAMDATRDTLKQWLEWIETGV